MTVNDLKHMLDGAALVAAAATLFHYMPDIAATMAAIWYLTRFYEYIKSKFNVKSGK